MVARRIIGPGDPLFGGLVMTRILGWLTVALSLSIAVEAGVAPGSISGSVKSSSGIAQRGAVVEMLALGTGQQFLTYTDTDGHFSLAGLIPGNYDIRVSAPAFLPTIREDVTLAAGASKIVNITLNTIFDAAKMIPPRKSVNDGDEPWKWTYARRLTARFSVSTMAFR